MIFGFNTDVRHAGIVYHVQSEARTHEQRLQTQVFVKGRCIGTRTASYGGNFQEPGFSEQLIQEMLKEQHRYFVAAAREGRIEAAFAEAPAADSGFPFPAVSDAPPFAAIALEGNEDNAPDADLFPEFPVPATDVASAPAVSADEEPGADFRQAARAWTLHPLSAVIGNGLSFDCLPPASAPGGSAVTIAVQVADETGPAAEAEVSCRITSAAGPATYVYAISSEDGLADLPVSLDELDLPTAALLIRASLRGKSASRKYQLREG